MSFLSSVKVGGENEPIQVLAQEVKKQQDRIIPVVERALEAIKEQVMDLKLTNMSLRGEYKELFTRHCCLVEKHAALKLEHGIDGVEGSYLDEGISKNVQEEDPTLENEWVYSKDEEFVKKNVISLTSENGKLSSEIIVMKLEIQKFQYENQVYERLSSQDEGKSDVSTARLGKKVEKFLEYRPITSQTVSQGVLNDFFNRRWTCRKEKCADSQLAKILRDQVDFRSASVLKQFVNKSGITETHLGEGNLALRSSLPSQAQAAVKDLDAGKVALAKEFYHSQLKKERISKEMFGLLVDPLKGLSAKRCDLKRFIYEHSVNKAKGKSYGSSQEVVPAKLKQDKIKAMITDVSAFILRILTQ